MANTKSAAKAARQNTRRREVNVARMSACKTYMKKFKTYLIQNTPQQNEAFELFQKCQQLLHKAVNKNILKPNNAARKISKIHALYKNKFALNG